MATTIPPPKQVFAIAGVGRSTSEISRPKSSNESPPSGKANEEIPELPEGYSIKDLLLLLAILFCPMFIVSIVFLVLLLFPSIWNIVFRNNGTNELPVDLTRVSNDSYYTTISQGKVSLVSSWASHTSVFVMPYFMVLFSYCVAREVALRRPAAETINNTPEIYDLLHGLLKGAWKETWAWVKFTYQGKRPETVDNLRALHLAAVGMLTSLLFAVLLIGGENWLHISMSSPNLRYYNDTQPANVSDFVSWSSYTLNPDLCNDTLFSALLDPFAPSDVIPCSLNNSAGLYDLAHPEVVYTILETGISSLTNSFNEQDWSALLDELGTFNGAANQVVTYDDPDTNQTHAFLFYQLGAYQFNYKELINFGWDFVAKTISMSTECRSITQDCQLFNATDTTSHNLSIPYNCSSMFSGDLNVPPYDGLEQFRGWDTSFYAMSNGFPKNISVASQLNPFYFNVTAAVISTTFADIAASEDSDIWSGAIVDAGSNRVAFALSCNSTIYDVQYSLINGSITSFKATPSDPRKASIFKAPIQVGFGRHNLFNAANLAMLNMNDLVADAMAVSFSQVGIALASGAFNKTPNIEQRYRFDQVFTQVPKSAFWFLVVVCLTYAAMGLVIAIIAFCLRRTEGYARVQNELLPREKVNLVKLVKGAFGKVTGLVG